MTASFHYEFTTIEDYFQKMLDISSVIGTNHINCEMVSNIDNQELVYKFRDMCKENNLDYKIEKNLKYKIADDLLIDSSMKDKKYYFQYDKNTQQIKWSDVYKDGYEICDGRYLLIFDDGTYRVCPSRNNLYQYDDIEGIIKPNLISTSGYYCNNGINFMNIVGNKITNCFY
jgi:regulator of replication initiation timing